jgi:hypothetical protein
MPYTRLKGIYNDARSGKRIIQSGFIKEKASVEH